MLHFKLFCILLSTCGSLRNSFAYIFCIMHAEHCTHLHNKFPKTHNLPWFFSALTDFLPQLKSELLHFIVDDVLSFLKLNYQIGQTVFCCIEHRVENMAYLEMWGDTFLQFKLKLRRKHFIINKNNFYDVIS